MPTTTLSNEEILEAIGNKTVVELAELIEAFKTQVQRHDRSGRGSSGGRRQAAVALLQRRRLKRRPSGPSS